jgi:mRNA interferase MazF
MGGGLGHSSGGRGVARFVSGEIVVVPFPFTDLQSAKVRPALVLASLSRGDIILCQITSQIGGHPASVQILSADFDSGGLTRTSFALPHRIVTANESCVRRSVGRVKAVKLSEVRDAVCAVIRRH